MVVPFLGFRKSAEVRSSNIGKVPEVDLPVSKTASLSMTVEVGDRKRSKI